MQGRDERDGIHNLFTLDRYVKSRAYSRDPIAEGNPSHQEAPLTRVGLRLLRR
jgi:hypothetical protein